MENYSQRNEQDYILSYFKGAKGKFLDIGAYDGRTFSNTHALALKGWKGVCVEPSPSVIPALEELYKGNKNIEIIPKAVGHKEGRIVFYDSNGDAVSTIFKEEKKVWESAIPFKEVEVDIVTPQTLVSMVGGDFDMINIDVEGDSLALYIMDKLNLRPKMWVIEVGGDLRKKTLYKYSKLGYKQLHQTAENIILCL